MSPIAIKICRTRHLNEPQNNSSFSLKDNLISLGLSRLESRIQDILFQEALLTTLFLLCVKRPLILTHCLVTKPTLSLTKTGLIIDLDLCKF